ncbi:MAG: hypothetical protein CVU60_15865 [Deltaproteobacteria bacterium HGW-Deltaproteobacteria-18]|nr:MAG: hypothetical protein CVU60_15865 [Deltaproteobacteria bacterium HGW-Deltaproteobacteria-18]
MCGTRPFVDMALATPPELLRWPRSVESLRARRQIRTARRATIQQTMPGSVKQPTRPRTMPKKTLRYRRMIFYASRQAIPSKKGINAFKSPESVEN